jgi:PAS domain S-box-containing protein
VQSEIIQNQSLLPFVQDGGEAGELIRNHNWRDSSLGDIHEWPQSLRATLGILLHSAFPMFLFWGKDLLCFYNDAFRPSLGSEGKHPAIGKKGKEVWPEIWDFIGPLIEKVLSTGEPVWFEDQLVPFYRNGKIENIYWTFSYSPAYGDDGKINGVFVTCMETTSTVTGKKRLEESESFFRNMVELAPIGITVTRGEDLFIETVNMPMVRMMNKNTKEEVLHKTMLEVLPELQDQAVLQHIKNVLRTGVPYEGIGVPAMLNIKGKLEEHYFDLSYTPVFENNIATAVLHVAIDVTERVLSRKRVEESEHLFRLLIEEAPVAAAFYTGKEIRIRYANNIMIGYWGKDKSVIGKTFREALPELNAQHFPDSLEKVFATGEAYVGTRERADMIVNGKIESFYFNFTYKPLRNKEGEIFGIHHTAIDVTHEVLAQKQLEESEKTLRNIILQAPVAMCIFKGPEFIIEVANDNMFELWGKQASEVLHKPVFEALPEVKDQGFEAILDNVFKSGKAFSANELPTYLLRNGKLEEVFVNFTYQPVHEADASISGIIAVATDVSEQVIARKRMEQNELELQNRVDERTRELANANNELIRSNAHLEEFAYAASHDLKEPIRKIHFFTNRLKNQLAEKLTPQDESMFERVEYASQRMNALIDDLLLYSHVSQKPLAKEPVDLYEKVNRILHDLELDIEAKGAIISVGPLPVVHGYRRQLQQLFHNLLTNALKYSSTERKPEISIDADIVAGTEPGLNPEKKYHLITVSDNGIGFEQDQSEKIFQMFQRLHGKSEYEGTGVGLSIARKVVENHDGKIIAEGRPGEGATFRIYLAVEED